MKNKLKDKSEARERKAFARKLQLEQFRASSTNPSYRWVQVEKKLYPARPHEYLHTTPSIHGLFDGFGIKNRIEVKWHPRLSTYSFCRYLGDK